MPNKKRLLRLSLRTLLVVVTVVALGVAWVANYAQKRKAALAAIREVGGEIRMGVGEPTRLEKWFGSDVFGTVNKIDLRECSVDNELLKHIGRLEELRHLDLSYADIDDEGVRLIAHLPLRELWLQSTRVTDKSAETLSQMKTLDFLQLNSTSLSDEFLKQLQPLPELEDLGLRGAEVSGAGMAYLLRHPKLRILDVYHTEVDDAGVGHLADCPSLERLGLSHTHITDAVLEHLGRFPKLTDVDLTANRPMTTEAVHAFAQAHPTIDVEWYRK